MSITSAAIRSPDRITMVADAPGTWAAAGTASAPSNVNERTAFFIIVILYIW
jgi:hypothetical protein